MDESILKLLLACLILSSLLNLLLVLRMYKHIQLLPSNRIPDIPLTLPTGSLVPGFSGQSVTGGHVVSFDNSPTVLVFLSSRCHSCRSKIPQLELILPAADKVKVSMWVVLMEGATKADNFLRESPLLERAMSMETEVIKVLNPRTASPFYLLIDESAELQASGMIGDEDWEVFIGQMKDILEE